jgi:hypothetical protein
MSEDLPEPLTVRRWRSALTGPCPNERRPDAVDEVLARGLGTKQGQHDDLLVGILYGVHNDRLGIPQPGQDLADSIWTAHPDVSQRDGRDLVSWDPARGLFRDPIA